MGNIIVKDKTLTDRDKLVAVLDAWGADYMWGSQYIMRLGNREWYFLPNGEVVRIEEVR